MLEVYIVEQQYNGDPSSGRGAFHPATGWEDEYYIEPNDPMLSAVPASDFADWVAKSGIKAIVKINPPYTRVEYQDGVHDPRSVKVDDFPPHSGCYIYEGGRTIPQNLAELVQVRIDQGWNVDQELSSLLHLTQTE